MDEKQKNTKATAYAELTLSFAISLFLIGGELLRVGGGETAEGRSSGVAFLLACLLLSAAAPAARSVFGVKSIKDAGGFTRRVLLALFGIFAAAAAIFVALDTAREFSAFASRIMFLRAPALPIGVSFLAFCAFLASRGARTVRKFALVSVFAVGAGALLLLLVSLPSLALKNISFGGGDGVDFSRSAEILVSRFAPICVALVYFGCEWDAKKEPRVTPRSALVGVLVGGAILAVCYFNVLFLLGGAFANGESYPYSVAVSAVSAGKLFLRMEGVAYLMYFLSMSVRAAVSIGTLLSLARKLLPLKPLNR